MYSFHPDCPSNHLLIEDVYKREILLLFFHQEVLNMSIISFPYYNNFEKNIYLNILFLFAHFESCII